MKKAIRAYRQHSTETCGPSCVLMLLDYYDRVYYPTPKMEDKFYNRYRVAAYKGMTGAAIADCLSFPKNALSVHLVQSFGEQMDNLGNLFSPEEYEAIMASHRKHLLACKDRIRLSAGMDFGHSFLRRALEAGNKIILEIFVPETEDGPPSVLHWVILDRFDPNKGLFRVLDPIPRRKPILWSAAELDAYMTTPIGRLCILVKEDPRFPRQSAAMTKKP